ncbi:MAG: dienelactone hydrolase [Armatimonadetes bacterium]|nr:dienelactone hydrolase [Anaerolineae bacterium]
MKKFLFALLTVSLFVMTSSMFAQENYVPKLRLDAPELAALGSYTIGVRTLELVNPAQLDIVNTAVGGDAPVYDRSLTVEVWYPAALAAGVEPGGEYSIVLRDGTSPATLTGLAVRDADPDAAAGPFPLVIMSHGYPGNRFLLAHLGENLASKGYVVVSIDHTDSTYSDQNVFGSTLYNRPIDQHFVLDTVTSLNADSTSFLSGLVDADNTAIIGYSMGGYGALISVGGALTAASADFGYATVNGLLARHQADNADYQAMMDPRIKAVVAFAPWGNNTGFWDADGLAGITTPVMLIAGSKDDVAGYEIGALDIFGKLVNSDRYLLTFINANHNAGAPIPPPAEITTLDNFAHYSDAVWDNTRMNNISQHFITAYLGIYLKGEDNGSYLDLVENAADGVYSANEDGTFKEDHTYWAGFQNRTALGLALAHKPAGE